MVPTPAPVRRRALVLVVVAALAGAAAGCSTTTTASSSSGTAPRGGAAGKGSSAPAEPKATVPVVTVKIEEHGAAYGYDADDTVPAGWVEIDLVNNGTMSHQANFGIVPPEKVADIDAAMKSDPVTASAFVEAVGGPNSILPGGTAKVIVDLTPGVYYFSCFVPDDKDGKPHAAHGMVKRVTVGGPAAGAGTTPPAAAPAGDPVAIAGEIEMKDYTFLRPDGFTGKGWYKVTNDGPQEHEMTIIRLRPGVTADQAMDLFVKVAGGPLSSPTVSTLPTLPLPYEDLGGLGGIGAHHTAYVWLDLTPGSYVAMCYVPDQATPGRTGPPADLKAHFTHGMWSPFTIS